MLREQIKHLWKQKKQALKKRPIAARTRRHDSESTTSRTRSQQDLTDIAGFADVETGSNLNEW